MSDLEITPRVEALIWKSLGVKSARRIAEETGLKPEQVLAIKQSLLDSVDVLTVQQTRAKLLTDLKELANTLREDYDSAPWEFKSGVANSGIAAMKTVLVELNRADKGEQAAIERLNNLRVKELLRLIDVTVAKTLAEIADTHGLDQDELLGIFQSHLKPAAAELSA